VNVLRFFPKKIRVYVYQIPYVLKDRRSRKKKENHNVLTINHHCHTHTYRNRKDHNERKKEKEILTKDKKKKYVSRQTKRKAIKNDKIFSQLALMFRSTSTRFHNAVWTD
jgi:hypothetical protein